MTRATPIRPYHDSADYTLGWRLRREGLDVSACVGDAQLSGFADADKAVRDGRCIDWSRGARETVTDEEITFIISNRPATA